MKGVLLVLSATLAAAPAAPPEPPRRVLFVGLDGADWDLLDAYLASGSMPSLARLIAEGERGTLATLHPPLSPLVWTTMMTGVSPLEHRILDFTRFHPRTGTREPITADERRAPAVWTRLRSRGRSAAVFGLWATYPAEDTGSLVVSDRVFTAGAAVPGAIAPAAEATWVARTLAEAERGASLEALQRFLPGLTARELTEARARAEPYAHPVSALRKIWIETEATHALATGWLARARPDLAVVYFQGTDVIGHIFAPFAPPRQDGIAAADYARYHQVPELYFRRIDAILGDYLALAERQEMLLFVASDHGFRWREGRPRELSSNAAATAGKWHRDEGIALVWGRGIAAGRVERRPVAAVFSRLETLLGIAATATGPQPAPAPAPAADGDAGAAAAMEKLGALGYLAASEPRQASAAGRDATRTPASYNNEGLLLTQAGRAGEARAAFARAIEIDPGHASALLNLGELLGDDRLLLRALEAEVPEGAAHVVGRALRYRRAGDKERAAALLEAAVKSRPDDAELRLHHGRERLEAGDCRGALLDFDRVKALRPGDAVAYASAGLARLCLDDQPGARKDLERSLALDAGQPEVRKALAELGSSGSDR